MGQLFNQRFSKILEDLQVETARIITRLRHNSSRSKLYDELGWDLLSTRTVIHKLILLYEIINGFAPQYLCDLLEPFNPRSHQYNLRNNNKSILSQIKTTPYMENFLPSTTKLWNDLPDFIKILPTLSSFKKHLK